MASKGKPSPTATTFAILGQLAWGEATTYELVKAMRRNLRFIWPRAESRIYEEAKRLVSAGWARARVSRTGLRPRTQYSITPAGRRQLRRWLGEAPDTITLEHAPLLRVFFGANGGREDMLAAIAAVRNYADDMLAIGVPLGQQYLDREHPQQHEVHVRALTFDFLFNWALLNRQWSQRAAREVERWPDTLPDDEKHRRALELIRATLAAHGVEG